MPSEDQLKSQMQAAIAKKKMASETKSDAGIQEFAHATGPHEVGVSTQNSDSESQANNASIPVEPEPKTPPPKKIKVSHPAIYQPTTATTTTTQEKAEDANPAVSSNAELTRSFFGRPIRVAIYDKKVYFAVPDVLNVSNDPDKHDRYSQLHKNAEKKDFLEGLIQLMRFPSPNGGLDKLDAATAENMIKIIDKLELKFPEPIEKWLLSITENLTVLL